VIQSYIILIFHKTPSIIVKYKAESDTLLNQRP